jgi:hypothetical protein
MSLVYDCLKQRLVNHFNVFSSTVESGDPACLGFGPVAGLLLTRLVFPS